MMRKMMTLITRKPRVFVLTSRIYETAGERTKATIERMTFLQKYFSATLIEMSATKYPGQELPNIFAKYNTRFNVINPWRVGDSKSRRQKNYLQFLKQQLGAEVDREILRGAQESFNVPTSSDGRIKSYIDEGKIVRLRHYHANGTVSFFALDANQNIFIRELYKDEKLLERHYLDDAGEVLSGFSQGKDDKKRYVYRTKKGRLIYSENIANHNLTFLNDVLRNGDVVISDVRYYDDILERLENNVRKLHVWHEIAVGVKGKNSVSPMYRTLTDPQRAMPESDQIVVFTEDTREEYATKFPHLKNNFVVIPYGTHLKPAVESVERDKNLVTSIKHTFSRKTFEKKWRSLITKKSKFRKTDRSMSVIREHKGFAHQIWGLAWVDLRKSYRGALLGWLWVIVRPLIMLSFYWFIIAIGLRSDAIAGESYEYLPWLIVGFCVWFFISDMIDSGLSAFRQYKFLITKTKFPVATIPTIVTISNFIVHIILLVLVLVYLGLTGYFALEWLQLPFYIFLTLAFMWLWSFFAAPLGAISKDFTQLVKSLLRVLVWVSGILWSLHSIHIHWLREVMQLNPIFYLAEGYRNALIYHTWFLSDLRGLLIFVAELAILGILAFVVYKRTRKELVDAL